MVNGIQWIFSRLFGTNNVSPGKMTGGNDKKDDFDKEIKVKGMFQNQFRNIGLYFSLFLVSFAYARLFRNSSNDKVRDVLGKFIGSIFWLISFVNAIFLAVDMQRWEKQHATITLNLWPKYYILLIAVFCAHFVSLGIMLFAWNRKKKIPTPLIDIRTNIEEINQKINTNDKSKNEANVDEANVDKVNEDEVDEVNVDDVDEINVDDVDEINVDGLIQKDEDPYVVDRRQRKDWAMRETLDQDMKGNGYINDDSDDNDDVQMV